MVRFVVTSEVNSHHTNPDWKCVKAVLNQVLDTHVHRVNDFEVDWLPRDWEVKTLVTYMWRESPSFRQWLQDYVRPPVTKLHELI